MEKSSRGILLKLSFYVPRQIENHFTDSDRILPFEKTSLFLLISQLFLQQSNGIKWRANANLCLLHTFYIEKLKAISLISQIVLRFASLQLNVMNLNKNLNISHQILKKNELGCDDFFWLYTQSICVVINEFVRQFTQECQ